MDSKEDFWRLRDMNNAVIREERIDLLMLKRSTLKARKGLFRLLDEYHSYIMDTTILMSLFEWMIEDARASVKVMDKINFYEY